MTQNEVLEDADETYLKKVQITYGSNGYPKGLGEWAVIGFDYFEDAEDSEEPIVFDKKLTWSKVKKAIIEEVQKL